MPRLVRFVDRGWEGTPRGSELRVNCRTAPRGSRPGPCHPPRWSNGPPSNWTKNDAQAKSRASGRMGLGQEMAGICSVLDMASKFEQVPWKVETQGRGSLREWGCSQGRLHQVDPRNQRGFCFDPPDNTRQLPSPSPGPAQEVSSPLASEHL